MSVKNTATIIVWNGLLNLSESQGETVQFNTVDFLKNIGREAEYNDREWLDAALSRLASCIHVHQSESCPLSSVRIPFILSHTYNEEADIHKLTIHTGFNLTRIKHFN